MKEKVRVANAVQHTRYLQRPRAEGRRGKGQLRRPAGNKQARKVDERMRQVLPSEGTVSVMRGKRMVQGVDHCWEEERHVLTILWAAAVSVVTKQGRGLGPSVSALMSHTFIYQSSWAISQKA